MTNIGSTNLIMKAEERWSARDSNLRMEGADEFTGLFELTHL